MMKISNLDIPVKSENNPVVVPAKSETRKTSAIFSCRDPFILPYGGKYYFYQGAGSNGVICSVSDDLENWSEAVNVLPVPENFHGVHSLFWAPECHYYKGNFYIFTSVGSSLTNHRSISVYRSNNPLGPFVDIAGGYITPKEWDAIDGTLYVDEEGQPWMVFVHEWTSMPDHNGGMCAVKLSEDFTHFVGEPTQLFLAREPEWANGGVTDGPYMYTTEGGKLKMIWSNFSKKGYVVAVAGSESGLVTGPWKHEKLLYECDLQPEFTTDGGHAMIFKAYDGRTILALHGPNHRDNEKKTYEHLQLFELVEENDDIFLKKF